MRRFKHIAILLFPLALPALLHAQCGKLAPNPVTGQMDCIGSGAGGTGNAAAVVVVSFSATPTFTAPSSTAGTVVSFQGAANAPIILTGNITSSTFASGTSGEILTFLFKQDATGGRTVAMPAGFDSCPVHLAANITTKCTYYFDGANGRLTGAVTDAGYSQAGEGAAPATNPVSGNEYLNFDSTRHTATVLNPSGVTHIAPQTACLTDQLCAQDTTSVEFCTGGGSANAQTATCTPANQSLVTGLSIRWKPSAGNTAATTIAVDGLTAKNLTKCGTTALASGDLTTTAVALATYDGTQFQLLNAQSSGGGCGAGGGGGGYTAVTGDYLIPGARNAVSAYPPANNDTQPFVGGATPGANGIVLYKVYVDFTILPTSISIDVLTAGSGTCQSSVGIYNSSGTQVIYSGLLTSATTVVCNTTGKKVLTTGTSPAATFGTLAPGFYYVASTSNETTGALFASPTELGNVGLLFNGSGGTAVQTGYISNGATAGALPASITPGSITGSAFFLPIMMLIK